MATRDRFNPFPGLRVFEADEDHLFFGRERQTDELRRRLGTRRFLAVIGGSGSGKSSLVRSGLIPSLQSGFMVRAGSSWRVATFRPGEDPIGNLAAALDRPDVLGRTDGLEETQRAILAATLRGSARGLSECVALGGLGKHENLLVVVDQFEELFRFHRGRMLTNARDEAVAFVKLLLEASREEHVPLYVVLTMRADFIGDCMAYQGLPEAINEGQYLVPRMTREDLRAAITGPVAVGGGRITPRLVVRLLNEVGDDPDQLPLLQHSLMRTWDYWAESGADDGPIDIPHYEAIGTMAGALSLHAEEAYQELIELASSRVAARYEGKPYSKRAQARATRSAIAAVTLIVRKMFKALTDSLHEARGIRRPTTVEEIRAICETDVEHIYEVVECFRRPGRAFLMPPAAVPLRPESILDISHESLMRLWGRLIAWTGDERDAGRLYGRLAENARRWEEGEQGFWRNPELRVARRWRAGQHPTAAWARRYNPGFDRAMLFLDRSTWAQRRRGLALILLPLAFVAALFFSFGFWRGLAFAGADADGPIVRDEGGVVGGPGDGSAACRLAALDLALEAQLEGPEAGVGMACEAYERMLGCPGDPDPDRPEIYAGLLGARDPSVSIALDVPACQDPDRATSAHPVRAVTFAHDGRTLVAGNEAGRLYLIDASTRVRVAETAAFAGGIRALAWSPARNVLAAAGIDGRVRLWEISASRRERFPDSGRRAEAGGPITALAFSASGDLLAAGGRDGTLSLWTLGSGPTDPGSALRFRAHGERLTSIAFSPDGRHLVAGCPDGALVWRVDALRSAGPQARGARRVCPDLDTSAVAVGDTMLACGGADGSVEIVPFDATNVASYSLPAHGAGVNAVSLFGGRDGTARLASGSFDGNVRVWKRRGSVWDPLPLVLTGHERWVWDVAFSPDGERLASGSEDRTVRLWETRSEALADAICPTR